MKIKGFHCTCSDEVQPPTHYTDGCPNPPMPLPMVRSILRDIAEDTFHANGRVTITRLLGCPRQTIIEDFIPLVLDLRTRSTLHMGTILHERMERETEDGYAEVSFPLPGMSPPEVFGIPLSGKLDRVSTDYSVIEDYKFHKETTQKWILKRDQSQLYNEDAQLNLGRICIAKQILEVNPDTYNPVLITHHGSMVGSHEEAWLPLTSPYMDEEQIGTFRPGGGSFMVLENIRSFKIFDEDMRKGLSIEDGISRMPLAGRNMLRGKKCTKWCAAREVCDGIG